MISGALDGRAVGLIGLHSWRGRGCVTIKGASLAKPGAAAILPFAPRKNRRLPPGGKSPAEVIDLARRRNHMLSARQTA